LLSDCPQIFTLVKRLSSQIDRISNDPNLF
jgi:hypothetical protein